jgi:hypothetical protein
MASDENLTAISRFLCEKGALKIMLLQYKPLWFEKNEMLGSSAAGTEEMRKWIDRSRLNHIKTIFSCIEII